MISLSLFITGTDTDIGKTYVSTLLFRHFIAKGEKPVIMKPIASSSHEVSEDAETIRETMEFFGYAVDSGLHQEIFPITYPKPLAPYAVRNHACPDLRKKLADSYEALRRKFTIILVEGIGGVLVPIEKDFFAVDIARLFGIPALVVVEDRLGAINHALLTFEALTSRGVKVSGFIMNRCKEENDPDIRGNIEIIEGLSGFPCLGKVVNGELKDCKL